MVELEQFCPFLTVQEPRYGQVMNLTKAVRMWFFLPGWGGHNNRVLSIEIKVIAEWTSYR